MSRSPARRANRRRVARAEQAPALLRRRLLGVARVLLWLPLAAPCLWFAGVGVERLWRIEVGAIRIEGDLAPSERRHLEQALAPKRSASFWITTPASLGAEIEALPWVARARAQRRWPPAFSLKVEKRRARAVWNGSQHIDEEGRLFVAAAPPPALPRLSGPEGSHASVWRRWRASHSLLEGIDSLELVGGCCWRLRLKCDEEVVMGLDQSPRELDKFAALRRRLGEEAQSIQSADLRYPNGMALRRRSQPAGGDCAPLAQIHTTELTL